MKTKNLTKQQKESIKHLGILELFGGCGKNLSGNYGENFNDRGCGKRRLCSKCKAKIQQTQKDFKRESEEVEEMIEFLETLGVTYKDDWKNEFKKLQNKIKQLKSKQDALILASELEE